MESIFSQIRGQKLGLLVCVCSFERVCVIPVGWILGAQHRNPPKIQNNDSKIGGLRHCVSHPPYHATNISLLPMCSMILMLKLAQHTASLIISKTD
jgi:hypothetical protein